MLRFPIRRGPLLRRRRPVLPKRYQELVVTADPVWAATANSDLISRSQPTTPTKPGYLGYAIDPVYGTRLVRISGDPGTAIPNVSGGIWGYCVRHHYSLDQAWNADESVLTLVQNVDPNCPFSIATSAATTSSNVLNFATNAIQPNSTVTPGYTVSDSTTPSAIPNGTTVTAIAASTVTISNTVTVASGNTIVFAEPANPRSWLYLDGTTYAPLSYSGNAPPGNQDARWHPTDPTKLIYVDGTNIGYYTPSTATTTVVHTFAGYTSLTLGQFKGFPTLSANPIVPIYGTRTSDSALVMFSYDLSSSTKSVDIVITGATSCQLAASGKYLGFTDGSDAFNVYDRAAGTLIANWAAGQPSHADVTLDQVGYDVLVGGDRSTGAGGILIKHQFSDGTVQTIGPGTPQNFAIHTSTRSVSFPYYAFTSYAGFTEGVSGFPLYAGEITGTKLDRSRSPYRLCYHFCEHGSNTDFYGYPFASVSPTGSRVIFGSNWGNPLGNTRPMQTYIADLRTRKWYPSPNRRTVIVAR